MVSSDDSSDTEEGISSKTIRLENIKMQNAVEMAFKKEQRRKERARQALRTGSGFGTLTGKPRVSLKSKKSIITHYLQRAPCRSLTRVGVAREGSSVMVFIVPSASYSGTVTNIYNNVKTNNLLSPGSATLSRLRPKKGRRIERGGTSPGAGQVPVQEVVGEEGQETGEIEDGCQHQPGQPSDLQSRIQTF